MQSFSKSLIIFTLTGLLGSIVFFSSQGQNQRQAVEDGALQGVDQQADCKVSVAALSGSYSGGCKNGLAQGKGIAQGTDHYEGQFTQGMPDGKGTYTWANGDYYEGQWTDGLKEGRGKMVYHDSLVTGYWHADQYAGEKPVVPYKIISSMSVARYNLRNTNTSGNDIIIKILSNGSDNLSIQDFSLGYTSGQEYRIGSNYGIQDVRFPLDVKIKYSTPNKLFTATYMVIFEFTIIEPGAWEVVISN